MSKTRHLDAAISIFRGQTVPKKQSNMRPEYEVALYKQGWLRTDDASRGTEFHKPGTTKRILVYPGDRVAISFDGITWKTLNPTARQRLLLGGQS